MTGWIRKSAMAACLAGALLASACAHKSEVPQPPQITAAQKAAYGPLAALAGTRWKGTAREGASDITEWSYALGGQALKNRHALSDGSYGGESFVYKNAKTGTLDYVYITSAGFHTTGTYTLNTDGSWTAEEAVTGHKEITRVRSTGRFNADGTLSSSSEYLTPKGWVPGHAFVYTRTTEPVPEVWPKPPA